ncbi:MAG: isopentenyl-diphosphate Delta-isomerase [Cytophagales bacterium]|nr:isopentenyl-diphosphate Delta-isomerase [Cytophagales bacterium]
MGKEEVILVDENDQAIGTMEKMEAHRTGALHRAFSILVFNSKGEMLLQKRADTKYHTGGLWSNACCSHPRPGEEISSAARRRLEEEMGITAEPRFSHKFIYKVSFPDNLVEHEYDHVFVSTFDGPPRINKSEVKDWKYADLQELKTHMDKSPLEYTPWFKIIMDHLSGGDRV